MTKQQKLINLIPWDKEWDDLSWDNRADYLALKGMQFLTVEMKPKIMAMYQNDQDIVEERGVENLYLYQLPLK